MPKKIYNIRLFGCHDSNHFFMELKPSEAEVLKRVAEISMNTAQSECQPYMDVSEDNEPKEQPDKTKVTNTHNIHW